MLEVAYHRLFDAEIGEKSAAVACILRGNEIHLGECFQRALGNIGEIAYRRADEIERFCLGFIFLRFGRYIFFRAFYRTHESLRFRKCISFHLCNLPESCHLYFCI